jgi:hypothetical protein
MRLNALVHKMDGGVLFSAQGKGDSAMDGDSDDLGNDDNGNDDNDRHVCA